MPNEPDVEAHGAAREREVREIAARLGVADFVYTAPPVRKGLAVREASGDGLLVVGERGAILQVKARDPSARWADSPERAKSWVAKQAEKAIAQGRGTRREITRRWRAGAPLVVSPVRVVQLPPEQRARYDRALALDASDWPIIVVIDHPQAKGVDLGFDSDVVFLTLDDWLSIHRRLRSASAMLHYVRRVHSDTLHVPLGEEAARYSALRAADVKYAEEHGPGTVPFLVDPIQFGSRGADAFHDIVDKVWPDDGILPWRNADEYRSIVEFLDRLMPSMQAEIGSWTLQKRREIAGGQRESSGVHRIDRRDQLVFTCSHFRNWPSHDDWHAQVFALGTMRHIHALETGGPSKLETLAIGALVEDRPPDKGVAYMFMLLRGKDAVEPMPPKIRTRNEIKYGRWHFLRGRSEPIDVKRNTRCPCGSGAKFKRCCGSEKDG